MGVVIILSSTNHHIEKVKLYCYDYNISLDECDSIKIINRKNTVEIIFDDEKEVQLLLSINVSFFREKYCCHLSLNNERKNLFRIKILDFSNDKLKEILSFIKQSKVKLENEITQNVIKCFSNNLKKFSSINLNFLEYGLIEIGRLKIFNLFTESTLFGDGAYHCIFSFEDRNFHSLSENNENFFKFFEIELKNILEKFILSEIKQIEEVKNIPYFYSYISKILFESSHKNFKKLQKD